MPAVTTSTAPCQQARPHRLSQLIILALLTLVVPWSRAFAQAGAPTVTITPAGGQYAGGTNVTVQVQFCDNQGLNLPTRQIVYGGVVQNWSGTPNGFGPGPCAAGYVATGTIQVPTGSKELSASIEDNVGLWSQWTRAAFYSPARWQSVGVGAVTPFRMIAASVVDETQFTVTNKGVASETITLTAAASPNFVLQALKPSTLTLAAGTSQTVTVKYTPPASGTGIVWLKTALGASNDSAWTDVAIGTPTASPIGVALLNPSGIAERSLCVAIAVGPAAAAECGALRLAHSLPSVMTRGKVRQPVLLYSDQMAEAMPSIGALVTLPSGVSPSEALTATVVITAGPKAGSYPAGTWQAADWPTGGGTRRITAIFDAKEFPSGHYPYRLDVQRSGGVTYAASGRLLLVNRATSGFNAGWWLAGLEQLVPAVAADSGYMWIDGDGSTRLYTPTSTGACTFVADKVAYPDTLAATGSGGTCSNFVRLAPNKLRVAFDASLRHSTTTNRLGEVTTFVYSGADLTQITLPTGTQPMVYTFIRSTGALTRIEAPGLVSPRVTTIESVTGSSIQSQPRARTTKITDPDASVVEFRYHGSAPEQPGSGGYKVWRRIDRRTVTTSWSYDLASRLATSSVQANLSQTLTQSFTFAESRGYDAGSVPNEATAPDSAFTQLVGPLGAADLTRWWVNGLGAPTRIRNAMGQQVSIQYDVNWPAAPVRSIDPAHFVTTALVDGARGLVMSVTQGNPFGTGNATQTIAWTNHPWSLPTRVTRTTALTDSLSTHAGYDEAGTGSLLWTRVGANALTNVNFTYDALNKQLISVQTPNAGTEWLAYDGTLRNVARSTSATGVHQLIRRDVLGRETEIVSPIDSPSDTVLKVAKQQLEYDLAGRVVRSRTIAPAMPYTLTKTAVDNVPVNAESLFVETVFDAEGNATRVHSYSLPNVSQWAIDSTRVGLGLSVLFGSLDRRAYDNVGRLISTELGSGPKLVGYDVAGNVVSEQYEGYNVPSTYDLLGRRLTRVTRAMTYPQENGSDHPPSNLNTAPGALVFPMFPNGGASLVVPADTARFEYDAAGRMTRADNRDARVRRSYWPGGALRTDTLRVRGFYTSTFDGNFANNVYGQSYQYDLAGRRIAHHLPGSLGDGTVTYNYDTDRGFLSTVAQGYTKATFGYDFAGRQISAVIAKTLGTETPGVSESRTYDHDGNVTSRDRRRVSNNGLITQDLSASYDARGRVRSIESQSAVMEVLWILRTFAYSGLGAVVASETSQPNGPYWDVEQFRTGGMGEVYRAAPTKSAGGNRYPMQTAFGRDGEVVRQSSIYPPGTPLYRDTIYSHIDYLGKSIRSGELRASSSTTLYTTASRLYYAVDNVLRFVQRYEWATGTVPYHTRTGAWEEYRYDALGRRVFTYTRADSFNLCNYNCRNTVERTVWDGAQVLYELRADGNPNLSALDLDRNFITGLAFGKAGYVHAGGIDRPLFMTDGRVPNYNWRGIVESSSWADGAPADCSIMTGTCTTIAWPGQVGVYMKPAPGGSVSNAAQWVGNVIQNGAGSTGLLFRRNRSFDPSTGQFTQQDPIGVAGGANVYGFAGGDPINGSDPFGLFVQVRGRAEFQRQIQSLKESDSEFRADYERAHADTTATYLISEERDSNGAATWGGVFANGRDDRAYVAEQALIYRIPNLKGIIRIGVAPGAAPVQCGTRHEMVHLRGLINGGRTQIGSEAHAEFVRINRKPGCEGGNEHRP